MLTFVKLGGSLITDKRAENSFRAEAAQRVADELKAALESDPTLQLLVGHGSGSFGHVAAKQYNTINGVSTDQQWRGFAHVSVVAAELNYLMAKTLQEAGVPVMRFQPSASARSHDGAIVTMTVEPIRRALEHQLVPLLYGDAAFDDVRGGTILSTETIFFYLAQQLPVTQILLLGEVEGVYDPQGIVIPRISPLTLSSVEQALGGSAGTDVTGGMETKVRDMIALVRARPNITIRIMSGQKSDLLRDTLLGRATTGTLIHAG
jgi:isopentenyl phosphate kinase